MDLHIERRGEGPQVVFTHGYGDDSSTWVNQVEVLSGSWSTVTWDLRAHGSTRRSLDGPFDRETVLGDLARVVDAEPSVLVGHSFGGYLSMLFAIRYPELVRALVLVATGPGFRDEESMRRWNDFIGRSAPMMSPPVEAAEMVEQHDAVVIDQLGEIDVPVLHIVGRDDTKFHAGHAYLDRVLARPQELVVDGGKHLVHRDRADVVNEVMMAFLRSV